jgi:hypothetical protein
VVRERQREHHAHHQRESRQDRDQQAEHHADDQDQQVGRLQNVQESGPEMLQDLHGCATGRP